MNFTQVQRTIKNLISAHPTFAPTSGSATPSVIADLGYQKAKIENSLETNGFAVAVWPPTKGDFTGDSWAENVPVDSTVTVRLEVVPNWLKQQDALFAADPTKMSGDDMFNFLIESIAEAVLGAASEAGGTRFMAAKDFFELMNFDEGLLAVHMRFDRFTVFGSTDKTGQVIYFPGTGWRFYPGKGWQQYNWQTQLWYTLINSGNPPEFDWDAGMAGPQPT